MAHVATVTIPAASVSADLTDYVVYVDLSDLPTTEFWGTVANGGGDIRCYKSDGTTQLAREVVSCDTATDTGELHVRFAGTTSSTADTLIQIWTDEGTEPAVTATYGRNATWVDYQVVMHLDSLTDSTGNTTPTQSNTTSGSAGQIGDAYELTGSTASRIDATFTPVSSYEFTFQAWANPDTLQVSSILLGLADKDATNQQYRMVSPTSSNTLAFGKFDGASSNTPTFSTTNGTYNYWSAVSIANNNRIFYKDDVASTADTSTATIVGLDRLTLGTTADSTAFGDWDGGIDEARLRFSVLSADWISTEYDNQNSPGTFYTVAAVAASTTVTPSPLQNLATQYAAVAATKLNGVLQ